MWTLGTRDLKHELRTPVNHIVGYSTLIFEAAQDAGNDPLARRASEIQRAGSELNRVVDRALVGADRSVTYVEMTDILRAVAPLLSRIGDSLRPAANYTADTACLSDMRRISTAAERLRCLLRDEDVVLPIPDM